MIFRPMFLDGHDRHVPGDWLVEANSYRQAYEIAHQYYHSADPEVRESLIPQKDAWVFAGVNLVESKKGIIHL